MCVREVVSCNKVKLNVCMYVCMYVLGFLPLFRLWCPYFIQLSKFNFILLHSKNSGLNLEKIIIFYFYLKKIGKIICMCVREVVSCNKIKVNVCMYVRMFLASCPCLVPLFYSVVKI